jgi:hypothetical protein
MFGARSNRRDDPFRISTLIDAPQFDTRLRSLGKFIPEDRVDYTLAAIFAVEKLLPIAGFPKMV